VQNIDDYGIDWQGPSPVLDADMAVQVPETPCCISEEQVQSLQLESGSDDPYAIELYPRILQEVQSLLA